MIRKMLILLSSIFFVLGCENKPSKTIELLDKNFHVKFVIERLDKSDDEKSALVYGKFTLSPNNPIKSHVNLKCFRLKVGELLSQDLYIDSVAQFNVQLIKPNESGQVAYDIYWSIDKAVDEVDMDNISLVQSGEQCIY